MSDLAAVSALPRPLVGVVACRRWLDSHYFHCVGEKYLTALAELAAVAPVIVPALGEPPALQTLLARFDGLLLTGSRSNIEPHRYGAAAQLAEDLNDERRDATVLALIRRAVEGGVPLLAICRGCQEVNVAYGGTLHQAVHAVPGLRDHREAAEADLEVQYGPSHSVRFTPNGLLADLAGRPDGVVNSLHGQGIDRLGHGLVVEATAPDGVIEAVRVANSAAFALAVQWHPEWRAADNPLSTAIFQTFGAACRARSAAR